MGITTPSLVVTVTIPVIQFDSHPRDWLARCEVAAAPERRNLKKPLAVNPSPDRKILSPDAPHWLISPGNHERIRFDALSKISKTRNAQAACFINASAKVPEKGKCLPVTRDFAPDID